MHTCIKKRKKENDSEKHGQPKIKNAMNVSALKVYRKDENASTIENSHQGTPSMPKSSPTPPSLRKASLRGKTEAKSGLVWGGKTEKVNLR